MFDPNMRYLPKGTKFFAGVWGCSEDTELSGYDVKIGDLLLCSMESDCNEDPIIWATQQNGNTFQTRDSDDFYKVLLVYVGLPNGKDFIKPETEKQALDFLGGTWDE